MKEKKYRKFELLNNKKTKTYNLEFDGGGVMYQETFNKARGYSTIIVGGILVSSKYTESDKEYVSVETIEDLKRRKEITDLLVDSKKPKKNQEVVYFHNMKDYGK